MILGAIKAYQVMISPLLGPACRFYPSCSEYAYESIRRHGFLRGAFLSGKRILKCHPFHPGGVDPVPLSVCNEADWLPKQQQITTIPDKKRT